MTMVVLPNDKLARSMAKKRVLPAVLASASLARRLGIADPDAMIAAGTRTVATGGIFIATKTSATIWMVGGPGVT